MKKILAAILALGLVTASFVCSALAFEPKKDVDVIVPSSAGGGSDLNARTIADVIKSEQLSPANFMVTNKPGGSGAVAVSFAATKAGNDNMIITIAIGQIISSYALNWDIKGGDLTPIAIVADDDLFICALTDRFKDMNDAIEQARNGNITFGSSQKANSDHLAFLLINKYADTKFKYVQFGGSGDVMSALLGKHVDVGIFNPGECIGQVRAGKVVPLASLATKRMQSELFGNAPTFVELGYPKVLAAETRVVLGPPKMSPGAVAYYENLMRKVTETERWKKDYIERNNLTPVFMDAAQTKAHIEEIVKQRIPLFKEAGL